MTGHMIAAVGIVCVGLDFAAYIKGVAGNYHVGRMTVAGKFLAIRTLAMTDPHGIG